MAAPFVTYFKRACRRAGVSGPAAGRSAVVIEVNAGLPRLPKIQPPC